MAFSDTRSVLARRKIDPVGILGSTVAGAAVLLPYVLIKENRVDQGVFAAFFELSSPPLQGAVYAAVIAAFLCSFFSCRWSSRVQALSAVILFALPWVIAGESGNVLFGEDQPFARISPSYGMWISMAGAFIILHSALSRLGSGILSVLSVVLPLGILFTSFHLGLLDSLSIVKELYNRQDRFLQEGIQHLRLIAVSVSVAILVGIPGGIFIYRIRKLREPVFFVVNTIQTVPSLALFGLMIAPLSALSRQFPVLRELGVQGIGTAPALIALSLYALLPIVRNTFTSLSVIQPSYINAGIGMGMNRLQLLLRVEFPLAFPVILSGMRIATVQTIGNATVAALIGAGGFGVFVFQGLGQAAPDLILLGVIPVILLAVLTDRGMAVFERLALGRVSPADMPVEKVR